jgi:hypothetical protein
MNQLEREIDHDKRSTVYEDNGYKNRTEYLWSLTEDHNVSIGTVHLYSDLMGPSEDFDGLVSSLAEHSLMWGAS